MTDAPVCQICGEAIVEGQPTVVCPACETPHHADCWDYVEGCSTFGCTGGHTVPATVEAPPILPHAPPPPLLEDIDGHHLEAGVGHVRLDLDTPLEEGLQFASVVFLLAAAYALPFPKKAWLEPSTFAAAAFAIMALRLGVRCSYVLDNVSRHVLYSLSIFGLGRTWEVASFDDVRAVGLVSSSEFYYRTLVWRYAVVLEIPGVVRVPISDTTASFAQARDFARSLAHHLGARFVEPTPNSEGMYLVGTPSMRPRAAGIVPHPFWGRPRPAWLIWFLFTLVINVLIRVFP